MEAVKRLLEDQVLLLKQRYGKQLRIKKGSPWPLQLSVVVEPPTAAHAHYDVEPVEVKVTLDDGCLQLLQQLQQGHVSSSSMEAAARAALAAGAVHVSVTGTQLAPILCMKINAKLADMWAAFMAKQVASKQDTISLGLFVPAQVMARQFVSLITSMPELVEAYQAVDELGRTVRRFTIIQPAGPHDVAAAPAGPREDEHSTRIAAAASVSGSVCSTPVAKADSTTQQHSSPQAQPAAGIAGGKRVINEPAQQQQQTQPQQLDLLPASVSAQDLCKDLQYFARRYPGQLTIVQPCHTGQATSVSADQVQQLLRLYLPASQQQQQLKVTLSAARGDAGPGCAAAAAAATAAMPSRLSAGAVPFVPAVSNAATARTVTAAVHATRNMPVLQHSESSAQPPHVSHPPQLPPHMSHQQTAPAGQARHLFQLELQPTDPAWERGPLLLTIELAPCSQQPVVDVLLMVSKQCGMPIWLRQALDKAMMDAVLSTRGLREAVRQLENYASQMEAAAEQQARAAGVRTALGQSGTQHSEGDMSQDEGKGPALSTGDVEHAAGNSACDDESSAYTAGSSYEEYETEDSEGDDEEEGSTDGDADEVQFSGAADAVGADAAGGSASNAPDAWAVMLEGLQLDHLVAVEALRTNLQVCCTRCTTNSSMSIVSDAVATTSSQHKSGDNVSQQLTATTGCPGCHIAWTLTVRPKFVHAASNILCVVKATGCTPRDLLPSLFAGQCDNCSTVMSLRNVQVGLPFERTCSSCHHALALHIPAVSFVPRGPHNGGQGARGHAPTSRSHAAARASMAKQHGGAASAVLQVGSPLPANGACKHYKHSYRWLRFPCCGQRYPCDLCHDEHSADGHEPRWATRMVCGFCSIEQPVAAQCAACGKKLATSGANPSGRRTRFWEGGEGCRDKSRMNRNDPHKYRNSKNKTKSAKHKRVGPKPWSKELKREKGED